MVLTNVGAPLTLGGALGKGYAKGTFGGITSPIYVLESTPSTGTTNSISLSQAIAGAGNLTITGALATGGIATMDVPRNVIVTSASASDTTQTATITGGDVYGVPLVETMTFNGTNTVQGLKAYKTVSKIAISAATAGNVSAGNGDKFGLTYRINKKGSLQAFWDATWNSGSGTTTIGSTATATAITGDVRGTYLPATASDGTRTLALWIYMDDVDSNNGLYGVDQFGG